MVDIKQITRQTSYWPRGTLSQYCYWTDCRGFFFPHFSEFLTLQQNLVIALSSNFLHLFNNSRRRADWNLVTFTDDLNEWPWPCLLLPFWPYLSNCWAKTFQIFIQGSLGYGHSSHVIKSVVICTTVIYGYIMFSDISRKRIFGRNFWTKAARMMILA